MGEGEICSYVMSLMPSFGARSSLCNQVSELSKVCYSSKKCDVRGLEGQRLLDDDLM